MPVGSEVTSGAAPYFFLSYAHSSGITPADEYRRNRLIERFRQDLTAAVRDFARGPSGMSADAAESEPPSGGRWSARRSAELGSCRSFVALYSDEYFATERCGKEWQAFADRLETDGVLRGRRPAAILPVPWRALPDEALPDCARSLPGPRLDLGPVCGRYGLNYLLRHLPEHRAEYESAVAALARRIVDIAEHEPPVSGDRLPDYERVPNAFAGPGTADRRPRLSILVLAPSAPNLPHGADPEMYGPSPTDWRPYFPDFGAQIAVIARRLAESLDFQVAVGAFEHSAEDRTGSAPTAPTLLLIDPWATQVRSLRKCLSRFDDDSADKPWIRPVVAWNREFPGNRPAEADLAAGLHEGLRRCRSRYRPDSPAVLDGLESIFDFTGELPAVIRIAERLYLRQVAHNRLQSAPDVPAPRRPRFRGPGPGLGFSPRSDQDGRANMDAERAGGRLEPLGCTG